MEHNCNTFANQFSLFLTGQGLPQYILDLPGLVLSRFVEDGLVVGWWGGGGGGAKGGVVGEQMRVLL